MNYPFVSVIMPVRNEAAFIRDSLSQLLRQDYPWNRMEILVIDGMSEDGTRKKIYSMLENKEIKGSLKILDNPFRLTPFALNIGLKNARGEVVIRVDGHCKIPLDYVRRCVDTLEKTGADCVGGIISTKGKNYIARAIASAQSSVFGVGNAAFRTGQRKSGYADTVPFGAYRGRVFEDIGGFDEELVYNQDDEFNLRLIQTGGKIWLDPTICSIYYCQRNLFSLWKRYFQYGFWKVKVIQKRKTLPSWRSLVPPIFVLGVTGGILFSFFAGRILFAYCIILPYIIINLCFSLWEARRDWKASVVLPLVFLTLHLSYGIGFLRGLLNIDGLFKRLFDLIISSIIIILLLPAFLLVSFLIAIDSRGPILFVQERIGRDGKNFKLLKFRTMSQDAVQMGPRLTEKFDPRITKIGRFLRRWKIDEWPQFFNVIWGHMSLVGPRPEIPSIVAKYTRRQRKILSLRPGIFGPSQIIGRFEEEEYPDGVDVEKFYLDSILPHKLDRDLAYLDERGLIKDFKYFVLGIIATMKAVFKRQ